MHVVRTIDDAIALREDLRPGARLVVIGAGFIGAEVASTARKLGLDVTIVEASPQRRSRSSSGSRLGAVVAAAHAANGTTLICGVGVTGWHRHCVPATDRPGHRRRSRRRASPSRRRGGRRHRRHPQHRMAAGQRAGTRQRRALRAGGETAIPRSSPSVTARHGMTPPPARRTGSSTGRARWNDRRSPWRRLLAGGLGQDAAGQATVLLVGPVRLAHPVRGHRPPGRRGHRSRKAAATQRCFLATYRRDGHLVAVLAVDQPRLFTRWRRQLAATPAAV